ncbi:MAG TPA: FAD-dependent monooxygenase, partial [Ktedonobacteraceae bacterium]|nr:FAD-dependent monooxygenase [Ktedonobacteraceae bacterium]
MTSAKKNVLIIGCGIAGPVVAMLLERIGMRATIYEAQSTPMDYAGSFQNMASNGLRVLEALGLGARVTADEFLCPRMTMWNAHGKQLGRIGNGASEGQGLVSVMIKRGQLHKILREEALDRGISIEFGKKLKSIEVTARQEVIATFEDNTQAHGDMLIGCDGIHSRTREAIDPAAPRPEYQSMVCCGGFTQSSTIPPTPGTLHLTFGK